MKKSIRIFICTGCFFLLLVSWVVASHSLSAAEKQLLLINEAADMMNEGIYIKAVPLLEEAAGYNSSHTIFAEQELKRAYLALIDKRGFPRKYKTLLEKQLSRKDAEPSIYIEAAEYYLSTSKTQEALELLRNGVKKTGDIRVINLYESARYAYEVSRPAFENVTAIFNQTIQVQQSGKWGIADDDGVIIIPCIYDKVSNFNKDRVLVRYGESIYAVDRDNNKVSVAGKEINDFRNYADNRVPISLNGNWIRATGEFELGSSMFEDIGMYFGGYAAAKINGKWGVIDLTDKWLVPAEYDEIILDELGRCFAQETVFVRSGNAVHLFTNGVLSEEQYEAARPFGDEGFAAVKQNGKWGFIDIHGNEMIAFIYDDALSFGQHLAAVKIGDYWGYISLRGELVIETVFYEAKSFSGGSAPVLTNRGWQIITLLEYKKGVSL